MNKKPNKIFYDATISKKFEKISNTGFVKGRARIAYAGANRNWSYISKDAFDNALDSLALVPIVGNWISEKNNYGGHDMSIEEVGNELQVVDKTRPYGVVPQNHNAEWVDVEDENGNIKKYVECDVILWKDRYEKPVQKIIDNGVNQSMEIIPIDASYNEKTGYYDVNSFYYSALCLLGRSDDNPEDNVEPCFEQSEVTVYQFNLDKDEFKTEFNLMMAELKQFSFEGGENVTKSPMEEIKDEVFEEELVEEVVEITEETTDEVVEELATEETTEEVTEVTETDEIESEEIAEAIIEEEFEVEETLSLDDYNQLLADYEILKAENEVLKSFKADVLSQQKSNEIEDVFSKYSTLLDVADFEDLKEKAVNMDIETLEKELSFRLVQKKFDFSKIIKKDSTKITIKEDKDAKEPYGSASVYFNK